MKVASIHHERQAFGAILFIAVPVFLVVFVAAFSTGVPMAFLVALVPALVVLPLVFALSALEVSVGAGVLQWSFRAGILKKSVPLADIIRVEPVRNHWTTGWGIRKIRRGWLYNVRGLGAVEVESRSGRIVRIGSDRPDRLADAIRQRM